MSSTTASRAHDSERMKAWLATRPDTTRIAGYVPGPGFEKLDLSFDIAKLRQALNDVLGVSAYEYMGEGFNAIALTRRPGDESVTANDLSGLYFIRPDETYEEVPREELVDERAFSEFVPALKGTYFEAVYATGRLGN